ncbi:hypothetical protein [Dictyobacter aurantiacus]|uniref:HAMP domain-containing protein n=1 Tax=Dictyobacter aurantiacus TaxID=1936993 RepID=A0A401Z9E4_9CHLR|nr:hypothetical protein [Dictyobacter aurantiacus]GCE03494.1 hypothetical protein KDAU_08230 [Dictyobacter aurantiacus]
MDTSTDDRQSQVGADTLNVSSSLSRTDALDVSDIKGPRRTDAVALYTQFYTFIKELTQVLEGDLRVKLTIPEGNMGVLAEVCNALIEKLVQFSRWTLYSAEQTISTSHVLLDHAVTHAQVAEHQILQIANVISSLEGTVTSAQRLSSALYLSAANGREQETRLIRKKLIIEEDISQVSKESESNLAEKLLNKEDIEQTEFEIDEIDKKSVQLSSEKSQEESTIDGETITVSRLLIQLVANTQKQFYTLEETSRALSENAGATEVSIGDLYTAVQSLHTSTIQILQMTEHIGELLRIAEDWKRSIEGLRLPEEEQKEAETGWLL